MNVIDVTRNYSSASVSTAQRSGNGTPATATTVSPTAAGDTLSISPQGAVLSGLAGKLWLEGLFGFTPKTPGQISIDEIEYHGRKYLDEYNTKLNALFRENGIDTGTPVEVSNGFNGSMIVTNNHPDKAAIEKLFRENPELGNAFNKINNMLTLAAAGREALEFQEAYAKNPEAAVRQYNYLFTTQLEGTLRFSNTGADILFHRTPRINA